MIQFCILTTKPRQKEGKKKKIDKDIEKVLQQYSQVSNAKG